MTRYLLSIIAMGFLLSGCNAQIEEFVKSGPKRETDPTKQPDLFGSHPGLKISPGANKAKGSQVGAQFAITPSQREIKGTQVKATFSVQTHRNQ